MLNFIGFFCVYWDDQVVFVFASVYVLHYIFWFANVESPLHPWDEANLVMMNDHSDISWDLIFCYFIEDIYINVH
jgi:hypothetical protein